MHEALKTALSRYLDTFSERSRVAEAAATPLKRALRVIPNPLVHLQETAAQAEKTAEFERLIDETLAAFGDDPKTGGRRRSGWLSAVRNFLRRSG